MDTAGSIIPSHTPATTISHNKYGAHRNRSNE